MTFEQKKDTKAMAITVGIHAILLLFFLLFKYQMPAQVPIEEMGIEVNLGTSEDGFGFDQPEDRNDPAAAMEIPVANVANEELKELTKEVYTTDNVNATAVNIKKKNEKVKLVSENNNRAVAKTITKPKEAKYVMPGFNGQGGNSAQNNTPGGNEGIGTGDGDMGVPGGTPGASNYKGTPGSGNMSYSLNNRTLVSRPDKNAKFQRGGAVVINVTVNPNGDIINSSVKSAANSEIRSLALEKLKNVRFNKATNAKPEEFGTITFQFK